jgi:ParB/RepB/Spo0J family partition protein
MNEPNNLQHISVSRIEPSRTKLRPVRKKDPEFVELMESIRTDGVLQPILVRPHPRPEEGYDYEVVEGNHRFAANKLVYNETIPCLVQDLTDREVLIIQLKVQAVRPQSVQKIEYARRLQKLMDEGLTVNDLCAIVDKGPGWVRHMLSLNRLTQKCLDSALKGKITASKAMELSKLPQHLQDRFLDDAEKMKVAPFKERMRQVKRDYDTFLLEGKQDDLANGINPRMRGVKDIMIEAETNESAELVLTSCNANSPEMGWKACLAWIMRIDPVSVEKARAGKKDKKHEFLNNYQMRLKTRKLIENLTFDTINTGDSHE